MFDNIQSAEIIVEATDTAFLSADLVTNTGSIIPSFIILTYLPVTTLTPVPSRALVCVVGKPALLSIILEGSCIALSIISSPILLGFIFCAALSRAMPPPGTIPSLSAALVAKIASSTRSFFSFSSTF